MLVVTPINFKDKILKEQILINLKICQAVDVSSQCNMTEIKK